MVFFVWEVLYERSCSKKGVFRTVVVLVVQRVHEKNENINREKKEERLDTSNFKPGNCCGFQKFCYSTLILIFCHNIKQFTKSHTEGVIRRYSVKKMFLEILENSQEKTCAGVSFLKKLQTSILQLYWKRHSGISVFKNAFFMEHLRATASKYVICKELFSLPHRTLKRKHCLNMLSILNLSFFVKMVF